MLERIITVLLIPALLLIAVPPVNWGSFSDAGQDPLQMAVKNVVDTILLGTSSDENTLFVFTRNVPDQIKPSTTFTIIDSVQAKVDLQVVAIVPDLPAGFEQISGDPRAFELNISAGNTVDLIYEVRSPVEEGAYNLGSTARAVMSGADSQALSVDMSITVAADAVAPPDPPDPPNPPVDPPDTNSPPVAFFSQIPQAPVVGEVISFDGSSSSDSDGTIVDYIWNFGDGTNAQGQAVVAHEYDTAGSYQVSLTVVDDEGASSNPVFVVVDVAAPPAPTIFGMPVSTALIGIGVIVGAALLYLFVARGSGGSGGQPIRNVNTDITTAIQEDVAHFLLTTGVPVSGVISIEVVEGVSDINRARWVRTLTNRGLIVMYSDSSDFEVVEYDSLSLNEVTQLDPSEIGSSSILEFVSEHVEEGDTVMSFMWETLDGRTFESLAVVNSAGQIKYDTFMSLIPLAITSVSL